MRKAEHVGQRPLDFSGRQAQVTTSNHEQRLLIPHRYRLRSCYLAHPWDTVKQDNKTSALALNKILARTLGDSVDALALDRLLLKVRGNKAPNDVLVLLQDRMRGFSNTRCSRRIGTRRQLM